MEKLPRSSRVTETGSGKVRRGRGGEDAGDHTASGPGLLQDVTPPPGDRSSAWCGVQPGAVWMPTNSGEARSISRSLYRSH